MITKLDTAREIAAPMIKRHEGKRLETYVDPVGINTIGYGHTGSAAFTGNKITAGQANTLLNLDMATAQKPLKPFNEALNPNQLAALTSFVFNVGVGAFQGSTLRQKLIARDYRAAANQLTRWNKGTINGQKVELRGLTKRRAEERELFLTPYTTEKKK